MNDLIYKNKSLAFSGMEVSEVANNHKTPFFLYSEDVLSKNYTEFYEGAKNAGLYKPLVCFALKSNPNRELLKILSSLGSGADIVSGGELRRALAAGIDPMKIVFSGVGKTEDEIYFALESSKHGIYSFNVESLEELELINHCAKTLKKTARICFRFNPVVKPKTHKYISTGNKTHKFGILEKDILAAVKNKSLWTHSKLVGLSIHIGSQLLDLNASKEALIRLSDMALATKTDLEFLDVGGGLGVDYHPDDTARVPTVDKYMGLIATILNKHYYSKTENKPRIVFEPGRRIVARAGIFVMKVLRNKFSEDNHFVIVDGGMNDFVRPSLYEAYHGLLPVIQGKAKKECHVVGPICETSDCFGSNRLLPPLKTGDLLVLQDTGAYGYSMGSNYNLRGRPLELLVKKNKKVKVVNEAQKYEDLT
ncbi:MAG TPA: diaminopimelate decarboxylase [Bacteriovoracaceae bacterium]|nr:diaminopimelate decarboxylase [Bacteriovoracaceae bacterium]